MEVFDPRVLPICRETLLHRKQILLNGRKEPGLRPDLQRELYEIEHALAKIQNGVFGYCEISGRPIERSHLLAAPWTRYRLDEHPPEVLVEVDFRTLP